ncbi:hypothetical protein DB347_02365 [Opitutaceae bacterium EW11]|nr:hypothetical protein DB347_02365 [Opitutaceae bacterium EW11]
MCNRIVIFILLLMGAARVCAQFYFGKEGIAIEYTFRLNGPGQTAVGPVNELWYAYGIGGSYSYLNYSLYDGFKLLASYDSTSGRTPYPCFTSSPRARTDGFTDVATPFETFVDGSIKGRLLITPHSDGAEDRFVNVSAYLDFLCGAVAANGTYSAGPVITSNSSIQAAAGRDAEVSLFRSSLTNISTRAFVGRGGEIEIAGFIVSGSDPKTLLVRANGPALKKFGIVGVLDDPVLRLFDASQQSVATNDDWSDDVSKGAVVKQAVAKLNIAPWDDGSSDAAFVITVPPGAYTAQISGKNSSTGVALIEVYDVSGATVGSVLSNISTRSRVDTGERIQIAGFIVSGAYPKKLLIRASGPTLKQFGVPGLLEDPVIAIKSGQDTVASSDDWDSTNENASAIAAATHHLGAFPLAPHSAESALVVTLTPGAYTVLVSGKNNSTGVALIEVYDLE